MWRRVSWRAIHLFLNHSGGVMIKVLYFHTHIQLQKGHTGPHLLSLFKFNRLHFISKWFHHCFESTVHQRFPDQASGRKYLGRLLNGTESVSKRVFFFLRRYHADELYKPSSQCICTEFMRLWYSNVEIDYVMVILRHKQCHGT